jgi:hypothetical protein
MMTSPNSNGQTPQNPSIEEINENLNLVVELLEQLPGKLRQLSDTKPRAAAFTRWKSSAKN